MYLTRRNIADRPFDTLRGPLPREHKATRPTIVQRANSDDIPKFSS